MHFFYAGCILIGLLVATLIIQHEPPAPIEDEYATNTSDDAFFSASDDDTPCVAPHSDTEDEYWCTEHCEFHRYENRFGMTPSESRAAYSQAFAPFGHTAYLAYPSGYSPNLGLFPYEKTVVDSGTRALTLEIEQPGIYDIVVSTQDGPDSLVAAAVSPMLGCNTFVIPEHFLPGRHFHYKLRNYANDGSSFESKYAGCLKAVQQTAAL